MYIPDLLVERNGPQCQFWWTFHAESVPMMVVWGAMVSLLIGLLYASLQLPLDNRENKKITKCVSEPNSRKYLPAKISTYTVYIGPGHQADHWVSITWPFKWASCLKKCGGTTRNVASCSKKESSSIWFIYKLQQINTRLPSFVIPKIMVVWHMKPE